MTSLAERLKMIRKIKNLKQLEFADLLDSSIDRVRSLETSRLKRLNENEITKITCNFNISLNWLLTGQGEMFSTAPKKAEEINQSIMREIIIGLERGLNDTKTVLSPEVKADIILLFYNDYVTQVKQYDNIIDFREIIGKDILRAIKARNIS